MTFAAEVSGTISPSGEGSWRIRYPVNGRRVSKTVRGSKTAAAKELRRLLQSADEGAHVAPDKTALAQWIPQWLTVKGRSIEGQTLDRYEDLLNCHVLPALGSIRLQKLSAGDIDRFYGTLSLAPSTLGLLTVPTPRKSRQHVWRAP